MSIYKPSLLDKFKDFVNGLRSNWDQYEDHLDKFSHVGEFSRSGTQAGVQNIGGLGFRPRAVIFIAHIQGRANIHSIGFVAEDNRQRVTVTTSSGNIYLENSRVISIFENSSTYTRGECALVDDGFDITWTTGTNGVNATISVNYIALGHGVVL